MSDSVAREIARAINMEWRFGDDDETLLTEKGRRLLILIAARAVEEAANVLLKEQRQNGEETPEQNREEVTGLSTKGKSANLGNSGFSGGCITRLATA